MMKTQHPHLPQRIQYLETKTNKLIREEKQWLPIEAATGVAGGDPEEEVLASTVAETLRQALELLPERERVVLEAVQLDSLWKQSQTICVFLLNALGSYRKGQRRVSADCHIMTQSFRF